jgi:AraC family transcriptional regulator
MSATLTDHCEPSAHPNEVSRRLAGLLAEMRVAMRRDPVATHLWLDKFELLWRQSGAAAAPSYDPEPISHGGLAPWQALRVTRHVDANLAERLSIGELATLARLSNNYFARAFKTSLGCTPHTYVIERRIEQAKKILLESDTPLSQVALDCGMADQAHLSRLFRRLVGETPSVWRRQNRMPSHAFLPPETQASSSSTPLLR